MIAYTPTVSIIINTCDRAEPLQRLLYAFNRQTYPNFEVVVVLGPTRDNSQEIVQAFGRRVRLVRCPEFNLSLSRNLGLAAAAGELVAFIDDDAIPANTWLAQLVAAFANPGPASAGGKVYQVHSQAGYIQFINGYFSALADDVDVRPDLTIPLPGYLPLSSWFPRLMGANMAFRRAAVQAVGGFDEWFAYLFEEPDVAIRLARHGFETHHLAEAVVYHAPASGRNRQLFTWKLNWYAWMRGIIYFTLKNGPAVAGFGRAFSQALQHCQTFFHNVKTYRQDGSMPDEDYREITRQLWRGIAWGFWHGLVGRRRLRHTWPEAPDFQPFLVSNSAQYRAISAFTQIQPQDMVMSQESLRIALVSLNYPPIKTDGVARSTATLAAGLAQLGHEVHVIKEGLADQVTCIDDVYVHEVRSKGSHYARYRQQGYSLTADWLNASHAVDACVQSLLLNHEVQVLDSPLYQVEGLVTAVANRLPVVVRLVTGIKQIIALTGQITPDTELISDLERQFLQLSDGIVANTQATYQAVEAAYGLSLADRPIATPIIYYGLQPAPQADVFPLETTPVANPIVLYVGRLEKRKGVLDLFAAIPQVAQRLPGVQFWLVGQDNSEQDGFKAASGLDYPRYFRRHYPHYEANVRFLGYVPDDKLPQLYQNCDLFVAPSLYESFGLIYLEAMNYARPVIGGNAGGPTEIIQPGVTGYLVEPEQPNQLAEQIIELLLDRKRASQMGQAGRQRLLDNFTHLHMAQGFAQFYRQVINK